MATTPNMTLGVLYIGQPDPGWESSLIQTINTIDAHTHDGAGHGVKIAFNNLNLTTSTPSMAGQPLTQAQYYGLTQQASIVSPAAGTGVLETDTSGNLWYVSSSAQVLLASATSINYTSTAKGFVGDYGNTGTPTTGGAAYYNQGNSNGKLTTFYFTQKYNPISTDFYTDPLAALAFSSGYMTGTTPSLTFTDTSGADTKNTPWKWGYVGNSSGYGSFGLQAQGTHGTTSHPITFAENQYSYSENTGTAQYQPFTLLINATPFSGAFETIDSYVALTVHNTGNISSPNVLPMAAYWAYNPGGSYQGFGGRHHYGAQQTSYSGGGNAGYQFFLEHYWVNASPFNQGGGRLRPTYSNNPYTAIDFQVTSSGGTTVALGNDVGAGYNSASSIYLYGNTVSASIIPLNGTSYNLGSTGNPWNYVYANNISATNVTVTGTLTTSGSLAGSSFIPTAGYSQGNSFGLYVGLRVLGHGVVNSGTFNTQYGVLVGGSSSGWSGGSNTTPATLTITLGTAITTPFTVVCTSYTNGTAGSQNYLCVYSAQGTSNTTIVVQSLAYTPNGTGSLTGVNITPFNIMILG